MLKKINRLNRDRDIKKVFRLGKRCVEPDLSILTLANTSKKERPIRVGFIVSNKVDKLATRRNKLKRILRQAVRGLISGLCSNYDVVVTVKPGIKFPYHASALEKQVKDGIGKLQIIQKSKIKIQN